MVILACKIYDNDSHVILCLYVDNVLIRGTTLDILNSTKKILDSNFNIKELGETNMI